MRKLLLAIAIIVIVVAIAAVALSPKDSNKKQPAQLLDVHFIDVGQGDSILVDMENTEVLIDGGLKSPGVVDSLKKYVDGPLEVMVATHPHSDHISGLIDVLKNFDVEQFWHNGETSASQTYGQLMQAVDAEGAGVHIGRLGDTIQTGDLRFTVLNPPNLDGTVNNNSLVLSLIYGNVDFLFEGDAEKEAEANMLTQSVVPVPQAEILKVGHHGSRTASSPEFLKQVHPKVAIYMAGTGNTYGHPHKETLANLVAVGAEIYGTDRYGSIEVSTDGTSYQIKTAKQP